MSLAVVASIVLAACGGGESAEHKQYVSAAETGLRKGEDKVDATTAHCMALALVDKIGIDELKAAKLTQAKLRDPDSDLSALKGKVSSSDATAFAKGVQSCKAGEALAKELPESMGVDNATAAQEKCFATRFDSPEATDLVAAILLSGDNDNPTRAQARTLMDILVGCFDFGSIIASSSGMKLSATETGCFTTALRKSGDAKQALADALAAGQDPDKSSAFGQAMAALAVKCLDFATLIGSQLSLELSTTESTCINTAVKANPTVENQIAGAVLGGADSAALDQQIGAVIIACLTPAHIAQLQQQSGGA